MMRLVRMNAVALKVSDLERSIAWYHRHFGFEYRYDAAGCVVIAVGDIELTLSPHSNPAAPLADPRDVRCIHTLAFEIPESEFQKAHQEFCDDCDDIIDIEQDEFRSIIVLDPDGYCVELYYNKPSQQAIAAGVLPKP